MKRKGLLKIEIFLSILTVIGIFFLIFNVYFILKGFREDVLYVNEKNMQSIKNKIEKSEYYDGSDDFYNVKKIQLYKGGGLFGASYDLEFTLYYEDGTAKKICDNSLTNLRTYIEENGYNNGKFFIMLGAGMILICTGLNGTRKRISNKIDWIDKQEMDRLQ